MTTNLRARLASVLEQRTPKHLSVEGARAAAVLIPIVAEPEPTLVLTVRSERLPSHKGQISFPGGSVDAGDGTPERAALREAREELGLQPSAVTVLGQLDSFPTFVSGYVVTPFVGWLERRPQLEPNPGEVSEVLEVPVSELTDEIRNEPGFEHAGRTYPTEAWIWNGYVIWGVTARILRQLLQVLAAAGLADRPGATSSWTAWPVDVAG